MSEIAVSLPPTEPTGRAPAGPRWLRGLQVEDTQIDQRGTKLRVSEVRDGGRTVRWYAASGPFLVATTTAAPTHPDYPTDEEIAAARAAARKARRA
jgi:hypothetical protein